MSELHSSITFLYEQLRNETKQQWQRDLPLDELLFDRWARAKALGFGERTSVYHNSYVYGDVTVGEDTWIGPFTMLDGSGGLSIGSFCSISTGVQIYTHDSVDWALSGGKAEYEKASVTIGDCCFIGSQTVIAKGVTIGDHCLIGAGAFVNRDIPSHTIAYGSPCKPVGRVVVNEDGTVERVMDAQEGERS